MAKEKLILSERAQMFAREYLIDLDAAKAARRAGYSDKTARQAGHNLLQDQRIKDLIVSFKKTRVNKIETTIDEIQTELRAIMFGNVKDFFNNDLTTKELCDITRKKSKAIKSIKATKTTRTTLSGGQTEIITIDYQMHDKIAAAIALGKHIGFFALDNEPVKIDINDAKIIFK